MFLHFQFHLLSFLLSRLFLRFYEAWNGCHTLTRFLADGEWLTIQKVKPVLDDATKEILAQKEEVTKLKAIASQHPFYKYNGVWSRELQNLVSYTPGDDDPNHNLGQFFIDTVSVKGVLYRAVRLAWWPIRIQELDVGFVYDDRGSRQVLG